MLQGTYYVLISLLYYNIPNVSIIYNVIRHENVKRLRIMQQFIIGLLACSRFFYAIRYYNRETHRCLHNIFRSHAKNNLGQPLYNSVYAVMTY